MAGYRVSNFDPMAGGIYGPPLRPYNWVQWTGVGLALLGIAFELAYLAAQFGWVGKFSDSPTIGSAFVLLSIPLINSRRQEISAEQQAAIRRRGLIAIAVGLAVSAVLIAAILILKGV